MRFWILGACALAITSCRTTKPNASGTSFFGSGERCEDTCAGVMASPALLGCVVSCSSWGGKKFTIRAGKSLYPLRRPDPGCELSYERRDADRVEAGRYFESIKFGFRYSQGIGDGGFFFVGGGLVDAAKLIDFSATEDRREVGSRETGGVAQVVFLRADPAHGGQPTLTAMGDEMTSGENKQLLIVLDRNFEAKNPFAKVAKTVFTVRHHEQIKHDIECSK